MSQIRLHLYVYRRPHQPVLIMNNLQGKLFILKRNAKIRNLPVLMMSNLQRKILILKRNAKKRLYNQVPS